MTLCLVMLVAAGVSAAPIPKEIRASSLDGHWKNVDSYSNGIRTGELTLTWTIKSEQLRIVRDGRTAINAPYVLTPRPEIGPNAYDYRISTNSRPRSCFVICTDDTLKIAMPIEDFDERPTSAEGIVGVIYFEFIRLPESH